MFTRREFLATTAVGAMAGNVLGDLTPKQQSTKIDWLAEVQTPPTEVPADAPKLAPLLVDAAGQRITTAIAWEKHRETIRDAWVKFLKPLELKRVPPKLEVLKEDRPDGCVRQLVRYESEPGELVEGYLLYPSALAGKEHTAADKLPGVVVLHQTTNETIRESAGVAGKPELAFGLKLAQRGIVAFCPHCFLWRGEGSYADRAHAYIKNHDGSLGMAKMLWDAQRGVDVLESLPYVDAKRLGACGHSLGAKETLYLAAFDERIRVGVFSEGGIGLRFSNWESPWYLGPAIGMPNQPNGPAATFTREHHELLALIAPRPFLLLGGESADGDRSWPFVAAALEVYKLYGEPALLGLYNHRGGHAMPELAEQRMYEWLEVGCG